MNQLTRQKCFLTADSTVKMNGLINKIYNQRDSVDFRKPLDHAALGKYNIRSKRLPEDNQITNGSLNSQIQFTEWNLRVY